MRIELRVLPALTLVLSSLALVSCRCEPLTMQVNSEVRASETTLDFGRVWVGDEATRVVQLDNTGTASLDLQVTAASPFSAVTTHRLGGGAGLPLEVTFAPVLPGAQEQALSVSWGPGSVVVLLRGEGVAVPDCAPALCSTTRFSFDAGACLSEPQADDTPCVDTCGGQGVCVSGECRAPSAAACDDGNPCTIDACSTAGSCVHLEAPLPVADPCQVLHCDPDAGVVSEPAEDGLSCGAPSCRSVRVCLNGACVGRPSGNSDDDCRYTDVDQSGTCFVTRSGKLRCYGSPDGGDLGLNFVAGATRVKRSAAPGWVDLDDALQPRNWFADAGFFTFSELQNATFFRRALTTDGQVVRYLPQSQTTELRLDAGAVGLCGLAGARMSDGGVELEGSGAVPAGAIDCVVRSSADPVTWYLLGNGDFVDEFGAVRARGVTRLSRYWGTVFMRGSGVFQVMPDGGERELPAWPESPERLSGFDPGVVGLCGTATSGNAWCLGGLPGTPSSINPNRPVELPLGPWAQVDPLRMGSTTWRAGAVRPLDAGASTLGVEHDWGLRRVDRASASCVLSSGELWCAEPDGGEGLVGADVTSVEGGCGVTSSGRLVCARCPNQLVCPDLPADDVLPGSTRRVWFPRDGGVATISYFTDAGVLDLQRPWVTTFPLAAPPTDVSGQFAGGCWVVLGQVWCSENGSTPERKAVRFPARKVSGRIQQGCALIGNNRVECWGVDPRFRVVQFPAELLDLEVRSFGGSSFSTCVLQRSGTVQCFGSNSSGELGIQPNILRAFEQVDP